MTIVSAMPPITTLEIKAALTLAFMDPLGASNSLSASFKMYNARPAVVSSDNRLLGAVV